MATTDMATNDTMVVNEIKENSYGTVIGQCKWFNDKLGYGFITVQDGDDKGKDIFVHHSGIKPLNSNYKTLKKGEYVHFDIVTGDNGPQGVNITGILGGSLMCDAAPSYRSTVNHDHTYEMKKFTNNYRHNQQHPAPPPPYA